MAFTGHIDFRAKGINFEYIEGMTALPAEIMVSKAVRGNNVVTFTGLDGIVSTYNLRTQLKVGAYGETWDCGNNKVVKFIKPQVRKNTLAKYVFDVTQEAMMQMIIYESSKNSALGAFCPEIYMVGKDEGNNIYIVNERLEATVQELFYTHYDASLIEAKFIKVAKDLALILKELYATLKFNHRDLHVANVMFNFKDGATRFKNGDSISIKLIDFGFSCLTYNNLVFAPKSGDIFASELTCQSEIRDMHIFLTSVLDFEILWTRAEYGRKHERTEIGRIVAAICASDIIGDKVKNSRNRYTAFNESNSIGSTKAALNCHPDVVTTIFTSLKVNSPPDDKITFAPEWAAHLVKLYTSTYDCLTGQEYGCTTMGARGDSLIPYFKGKLATLWSENESHNFILIKDEYRIRPSSTSVFTAPEGLIPALFEEFMAKKMYLKTDAVGETILFKFARNIQAPGVKERFKAVASALGSGPDRLYRDYFKLNSKSENVYALIKAVSHVSDEALEVAKEIEERSVEYIKSLDKGIPDSAYIVIQSLVKFDFFSKHPQESLTVSSLVIDNVGGIFNPIFDSLLQKMSANVGLREFLIEVPASYLEPLKKLPKNAMPVEKYVSLNLLEYAAFRNNVSAAQKIVNTGATFDSMNKADLFFLITYARFPKDLLLRILKACGAEYTLINERKNNWTPLMAAAFNRNLGAVQALGSIPGALFTLQDAEGNTCLHLVSGSRGFKSRYNDDIEAIIKYLIGLHPELVDIKNKEGMGPGNDKWVANLSFRDLIKAKKSMFGKYANTEKAAREKFLTGTGGRRTRRGRRSRSSHKRPVTKQPDYNRYA